MKPIVVPRKFIEECCDVFLRHPYRATTYFRLLDEHEWRYLDKVVNTLPLNIQEYKLSLSDLAPLARLFAGVEFGWLKEQEVFDCKWAEEDEKESGNGITVMFRR